MPSSAFHGLHPCGAVALALVVSCQGANDLRRPVDGAVAIVVAAAAVDGDLTPSRDASTQEDGASTADGGMIPGADASDDTVVPGVDAPIVPADGPVTTGSDAPMVQMDAPVAQVDAPVAQVDAPVAQVDAPVLSGDGPLILPSDAALPLDGPATGADAPIAPGPAPGACSVPGCGGGGALPAGLTLTGVWVGPAGEVWAVGQAGFVGRRAPETGAWCWCAPIPPVTLTGVWGASSDNVFAVGDDGTLLRFDGAHWLIYVDARLDLRAVFGTAANNVWAVGESGMAIRFDGSSWQSEFADSRYYLNAVWIDPAGVVRAAGSAGLPEGEPGSSPTSEAVVLRHAAAGAEGWAVEASFQQRGNAAFFDMSGSSATDIWAVGTNTPSGAAAAYGFIAHFDGTAWAPPPHPDDLFESRHFTGVAAATPDAGAAWFMGGTSGVRFDGASWMLSPPLAGAGSVHARGAAMYAVGMDGLVVRWTAATDWTVDHAPAAPPAVPAP